MSCEKSGTLLDAYFDGELDLVRTLEFEDHLSGCVECRAACEEYGALRRSTQMDGVYFETPAGLERKVRARLNKALASEEKSWVPESFRGRQSFALAASIAALVIGGVVSVDLLRRPSASEMLAQQVVSSHIRSLMANHLTDVLSSDQHTVKPWFNGKLDFAPVVKDLAPEGFPLFGGRLDYLDGRPIAALLYKRRQHTINLFLWPTSNANSRIQAFEIKGYNVLHWNQSGMTYWAISDLNARELTDFAHDQEH